MEWTTERRYRLYQDWTQEEIQNIKENMARVSMAYKLSHRTQAGSFKRSKWVFHISMASGLSFTKTSPLVPPTV